MGVERAPRARISSPKPGNLFVQYRTRGFRGHVARGHARTAGSEYGRHAPAIRQGRQPPFDERNVVRNHFGHGDAPSELLQPAAHRRARGIHARAGMHGVADGEHRRVDHDASVPQTPDSN